MKRIWGWSIFFAALYLAGYGGVCVYADSWSHLSSEMRGLGIGILFGIYIMPILGVIAFILSLVQLLRRKNSALIAGWAIGTALLFPLVFVNGILSIIVYEITNSNSMVWSQGYNAIRSALIMWIILLNICRIKEGKIPPIPSVDSNVSFKCPSCGTLLYSRNQTRCADCKAVLPEDLKLSEERKQQLEESKKENSGHTVTI